MNIIIGCLLLSFGSLLIGIGIGRICRKSDGLFIIDDSDDQKTQWILDVTIDPDKISSKKEIRLRVKKASGVV